MTDVQTFFKTGAQKRSKRRKQIAYALARSEVFERSGGRCEAAVEHVCDGHGTQAHHVRRRSQGGTDTADNLLWVCGSGSTGCHGWIHANPQTATALGLLEMSSYNPAPGLVNVTKVDR